MQIREITNIAAAVSNTHAKTMAESIVKRLIELRLKELGRLPAADKKKALKKIEVLKQGELTAFYHTLVNKTTDNLCAAIKQVADHAATDLLNAEYFNFADNNK